MKVMIGYDGTDAGKKALELVKKHAAGKDAEIYVVTSMVGGAGEKITDIEKVENDLEYAKSYFEEAGLPCQTTQLVRGMNPGEDLVQFANEKEIEVIVLAIERTSRVGKFVFGSTAQYVILEAKCPVVTIK
jgi:nucleotide-binding universal stress UspA family protein